MSAVATSPTAGMSGRTNQIPIITVAGTSMNLMKNGDGDEVQHPGTRSEQQVAA